MRRLWERADLAGPAGAARARRVEGHHARVDPPRAEFEKLVGDLDYPMFIVTARAGGVNAGCLVGFATQCSIDPQRFMVCLSRKNRTYRVAVEADLLVVHFVPHDAEELAELFGGRTGDEVDKFRHADWRPGPGDAPVLSGCRNWFAGRVVDRVDLGDHVGFVLEPFEARFSGDDDALAFQAVKDIEPGHPAT